MYKFVIFVLCTATLATAGPAVDELTERNEPIPSEVINAVADAIGKPESKGTVVVVLDVLAGLLRSATAVCPAQSLNKRVMCADGRGKMCKGRTGRSLQTDLEQEIAELEMLLRGPEQRQEQMDTTAEQRKRGDTDEREMLTLLSSKLAEKILVDENLQNLPTSNDIKSHFAQVIESTLLIMKTLCPVVQ